MPCYYTGSAEGDARLAAEESRAKLAGELTRITDLLCQAARALETVPGIMPPKVGKWWEAHREMDRIREEQAAITPREKELDKLIAQRAALALGLANVPPMRELMAEKEALKQKRSEKR